MSGRVRKKEREGRAIRMSRRLLAMRVVLDWGPFGWHLVLPDGRAARGSSGHPKYFRSVAKTIEWGGNNLRDVRAQLLNPYWGWIEVGSEQDRSGARGPRYVRQRWMERSARKATVR